jgi:hypothetical protein
MKRLILAAMLPLFTFAGHAQNTLFGFFGGAGTSLNYNYDLGTAAGVTFLKQGKGRSAIGADLFFQSYGILYDNEQYSAKDGNGNAGVTILNKTSYIFVTPKFAVFLGKKNLVDGYISFGAGFKMSGKETMRKWDKNPGIVKSAYDSTLDTSPNINSMVLRVGAGLSEHLRMGKKWCFSFTEDFGFIPSSLTKTTDVHDKSRTEYSPAGKLNPFYISLFIGITHTSRADNSVPPVSGRNRWNLSKY